MLDHPLQRLFIPAWRVVDVRREPGRCEEPLGPLELRDYVADVRLYTLFALPYRTVAVTCGGAVWWSSGSGSHATGRPELPPHTVPGTARIGHPKGFPRQEAPRGSKALRSRSHVTTFSKVRALTRVATAANEADLVELAPGTTAAQLERIVRAWKRGSRQGRGGAGAARVSEALGLPG